MLEIGGVAVQQHAYTTGKNATDAAMIIDAMDFLHAGRVDGFVLVSSDSDFTPLALRLRESGLKVYGIGEKKTPQPFIKACDKFVYVEILRPQSEKSSLKEQELSAVAKNVKSETLHIEKKQPSPETISFIACTIAEIADDSGWCHLGQLGSILMKKRPDFDSRNYGHTQLSKLLRAIPRFEVEIRDNKLMARDNRT